MSVYLRTFIIICIGFFFSLSVGAYAFAQTEAEDIKVPEVDSDDGTDDTEETSETDDASNQNNTEENTETDENNENSQTDDQTNDEETTDEAQPAEIVTGQGYNVPKEYLEKYENEEKILAKRGVVLEKEFLPRFAFSISAIWQLFPKYILGQPSLEAVLNFEFMYKKNLTFVFFGGLQLATDYRMGSTLLYDELMSNVAEPSDFYQHAEATTDVVGGVGFGGGFCGRLRLEESIKGLYMGAGMSLHYFKAFGFNGGRSFPINTTATTPRTVITALYTNAFLLHPFVDIGYTFAWSRFILELGSTIGVDLIFGDGEYVDLASTKFELLSGEDKYNLEAYTVEPTRFAMHFSIKFHLSMGVRF